VVNGGAFLPSVGLSVLGWLLAMVVVLAVAVVIVAAMYFRHQERMAELGKNQIAHSSEGGAPELLTPPLASAAAYGHPLVRATTLAGLGLGLSFGLATIGFGPWLLGGLIVLAVGLVQTGQWLWQPGLTPPSAKERRAWRESALRIGAVGIALFVGLGLIGFGPALIPGSILIGLGLGRLVADRLSARAPAGKEP